MEWQWQEYRKGLRKGCYGIHGEEEAAEEHDVDTLRMDDDDEVALVLEKTPCNVAAVAMASHGHE